MHTLSDTPTPLDGIYCSCCQLSYARYQGATHLHEQALAELEKVKAENTELKQHLRTTVVSVIALGGHVEKATLRLLPAAGRKPYSKRGKGR